MDDINKLFETDCLFARKFDEEVDRDVIDYVYDRVVRNNK